METNTVYLALDVYDNMEDLIINLTNDNNSLIDEVHELRVELNKKVNDLYSIYKKIVSIECEYELNDKRETPFEGSFKKLMDYGIPKMTILDVYDSILHENAIDQEPEIHTGCCEPEEEVIIEECE